MPGLPTVLAQVAIILATARLLGRLFRRIGQPQVMGEIVAGLVLGPSLLGWLAPRAWGALFPPGSPAFLNLISQVGLVIFMFLVGLELDTHLLRGQGRVAVVTSQAGIAAPFLLGMLLAVYLYPRLSGGAVPFLHFALFLGTAMSVTAFPVLARILTERRLVQTRVGTVAIACAAVDDLSAWCILAALLVLVRSGGAPESLWPTLLGLVIYVGGMLGVARPALRRLERAFKRRGAVGGDLLALVLVLAFASAWITERLQIHAVFGAFLMGVVMPKDRAFVRALSEKLEGLVVVLLLPLFFAFIGLETDVVLLSGTKMWLYCGLVTAVAIAGKLGGAMLAARAAGMTWRESGAVGVLLNTRGLMELVILNVGLETRVIAPPLFAMMVLMALFTTFMTTPVLEWIDPLAARSTVGAPDKDPSGSAAPSRHR